MPALRISAATYIVSPPGGRQQTTFFYTTAQVQAQGKFMCR